MSSVCKGTGSIARRRRARVSAAPRLSADPRWLTTISRPVTYIHTVNVEKRPGARCPRVWAPTMAAIAPRDERDADWEGRIAWPVPPALTRRPQLGDLPHLQRVLDGHDWARTSN